MCYGMVQNIVVEWGTVVNGRVWFDEDLPRTDYLKAFQRRLQRLAKT